MSTGLSVLIFLAVLATFGVLAVGIVSMVRGGQFNSRHSNRLMRARVVLQFVAILLIAVAFLFSAK